MVTGAPNNERLFEKWKAILGREYEVDPKG